MAKQTHIVQKGDTLGAIAKKFGANIGDISGFKSGNADLIFPGETLTIGGASPELKKLSIDNAPKDRANTIRTELDPGATADTSTLDETPEVNSFEQSFKDATTKKDEAFEELKGFRTKRYDELREERGLETFRTDISSLDADIASKKSARDASIAKVKKNPGASSATITGTVRGVTDQLNAEINNLIEQRNSKANEYNSTLSEIDRIVKNEAGDLESSLGFFTKAETSAQSALSGFQESLIDELRRTEDREFAVADDLRDFEQALTIARIKGSGKDSGTTFQLKFDPITGESFLFNPDTGQVVSPEEADVDEDTTVVNQSILPVTQQQQTGGGNFLSGLVGGIKDFFSGN